MFGIGLPELIIVLVIFLVIFGVGKLPELGGGLGNAIRNFKAATREEEEHIVDSTKKIDESIKV